MFPRLTGGIRWGLERTERLLGRVGDPHRKYPTIHVGGTNGKGSVSASIASILQANGLRVGLYTSPHLCTFRERIQVNGVPVSESALLDAADALWADIIAEEASFFEATTVIGFLALANAGVDIAVIEVGLGGRLDSTNVITPLVSVLTNVSLDHVQLLGSTLEAVATEKAGILKPGVPAITGESTGIAADVFRARAAEVGAPLTHVPADVVRVDSVSMAGTDFHLYATSSDTRPRAVRFHTPLIGAHQARNAAIAVKAVDLLPPGLRPPAGAVRAGLEAVSWPGRLQAATVAGRPWILDVAHNVAGVEALVSSLRLLDLARPRTVIVGVLGDKDWGGMLGPLRMWADELILTAPPTAPADRRWDLERVAATVDGAALVPDFEEALRRGAANRTGSVVVTGSFHTVGDALAMVGLCPHGTDVALPHIDFGG